MEKKQNKNKNMLLAIRRHGGQSPGSRQPHGGRSALGSKSHEA